MKHKIRKIVAAALLSMVVLGMSVPTLPASAASESVNGCNHGNLNDLEVISTVVIGYPNSGPQEHQVTYVKTYLCTNCNDYTIAVKNTATEPHKQVSGTSYCECGYYLH